MNFAVETYRDAFLQDIADLIVPIQQEEFGIDISYENQPDLADIAGFYQTGAGNFWVAHSGGRVVGCVALRDIGNGFAALRKMFVAAKWRGAEAGVAVALLNALVKHARQKQVRCILLGTTAKFLAAHRFYEKNGFVEIDEMELPATFPRMKVDTKFYRLSLPGIDS